MKLLLGAIWLLPFIQAARGLSEAATIFWVAPWGKDGNPGTEAAPFATPHRAQQAVRAALATRRDQPVHVILRGGTYWLTEPLLFGPEDSGPPPPAPAGEEGGVWWTAQEGEQVILSGGRRVTGWARQEGDLWAASAPWAKEGTVFRQLYVDGRRAVRARSPNADEDNPYWQVAVSDLSADLQTFRLGFGPGRPPALRHPEEAELVVFGNWEINRLRVAAYAPETGLLTLAPPHLAQQDAPWNWPGVGRWGFLEGAREFLDRPGEWYLDREAGLVYYLAQPGEDLTQAEVIAPVLPSLLEIRGTADRPVCNLHFQGLRFQHAGWELPPGGYWGVQACHFRTAGAGSRWRTLPAALTWTWAQDCSFQRGELAHLGACGLSLGEGCRNCAVEGNLVYDISGNGLMVGGPNDENRLVAHNRLANNHVHHCGVEIYGAVGIWVGFAASTHVAHNLVHDLPYTGISVGWQWNPNPTVCRENIIEYNHIYEVMQQLADGGGIYTLGFQPGTVLRGNLVHGVRRSRFAQGAPCNGFFIDEGSKGFLIEGNVIYDTADQPVRHNQNQPDWHTWRDNRFGEQPPADDPVYSQAGLEADYKKSLR